LVVLLTRHYFVKDFFLDFHEKMLDKTTSAQLVHTINAGCEYQTDACPALNIIRVKAMRSGKA